jgi:hypothetical protein
MRYVIAFLCFTTSVLSQQPKLLWHQDYIDIKQVLHYDEGDAVLYVVNNHDQVISIDLAARMVITRMPANVPINNIVITINDSVFALNQSNVLSFHNYRTGKPVSIADSLKIGLTWVSANILHGARVNNNAVDRTITVVDLSIPAVVGAIDWSGRPFISICGYDPQSELVFARLDSALVQISFDGTTTQIRGATEYDSRRTNECVVLSSGDVIRLVLEYGGREGAFLYRIDALTKSVVDSIDLGPRTEYQPSFIRLPNDVLVLKLHADSAVVVDGKSFVLMRTVTLPISNTEWTVQSDEGTLLWVSEGHVYLGSDELQNIEKLWEDQSSFLDYTQLTDGRVVASSGHRGVHEFDLLNGNRRGSLWSSTDQFEKRVFTDLVSARNGHWMMVGTFHRSGEIDVQTVSTTSQEVKCSADGLVSRVSENSLLPEWLSDDGNIRICSFTGSDYTGSRSRSGFHVFSEPCNDTVVSYNKGAIAYSDALIDLNRSNRTAISASADVLMAPFRLWHFNPHRHEVRVYRDPVGQLSDPDDYVAYSDASSVCLTGTEQYAVVDHVRGLLVFDPRSTGNELVIDLGTRHMPLTAMTDNNVVIVFDSATTSLRAVDVNNERVLWGIPLGYYPRKVLVGRDNRWLLVDKSYSHLDMYALDTTVSVPEVRDRKYEPSIFPNPVYDNVTMTVPDEGVYGISIVNDLGTTVLITTLSGTTTIPTHALPQGSYTVLFDREGSRVVRRFVVVR